MFPDDDVTRFFAWWEETGGGNVSIRCAVEQAWIASARRERMACVAICQKPPRDTRQTYFRSMASRLTASRRRWRGLRLRTSGRKLWSVGRVALKGAVTHNLRK
jgi:hypothetical protein